MRPPRDDHDHHDHHNDHHDHHDDHRHDRGRGGPRGFGPGRFGPGGPGGPRGFGRGGGPRAARGDVRAAILSVLADGPMHGYQLMREIEQRTGGAWRPSPGSVYPTLQALEDEDLIAVTAGSVKRSFELTTAGRDLLEANPQFDRWMDAVTDGDSGIGGLRDLVHQVMSATRQVAMAGTPRQVEAAKGILADTRKRLYRLLADDEPAVADTPAQPPRA